MLQAFSLPCCTKPILRLASLCFKVEQQLLDGAGPLGKRSTKTHSKKEKKKEELAENKPQARQYCFCA